MPAPQNHPRYKKEEETQNVLQYFNAIKYTHIDRTVRSFETYIVHSRTATSFVFPLLAYHV